MSLKNNNFIGLKWLLINEVFTLSHIILIKTLVGDYSVFQIVFIRSLSSSIIIVPILLFFGKQKNLFNNFKLNSLRVLTSFSAISIQFYTISNIQLAQASTVSYLRPAILTIFAYFFLSEKQTKARWLVLFVGFGSIIFIFSPEKTAIQLIALLALLGVSCGSISTILQKFLSKTTNEIHLMVWYSIGIAVISFPLALCFWQTPNIFQIILMIIIGLLATSAQYFFIKAYRYSEASFLAPVQYFHIIPIIFIGYMIFREIPSLQTLIGASLIVTSLIFLLFWEKTRK